MNEEDLKVIRENLSTMAAQGATQADIDEYMQYEGVTPDDIFPKEQAAPVQSPKGSIPSIDNEMILRHGFELGKTVIGLNPVTQAVSMAERATGGKSEDLLPTLGAISAPIALDVATGGASLPATAAASGLGAALGEGARQGVRFMRGRPTPNPAEEIATTGVENAASSLLLGGALKGAGALAKTKLVQTPLQIGGKILSKVGQMTAPVREKFVSLIERMADIDRGAIDYVLQRGPQTILTKENMSPNFMSKTANEVVSKAEQLRRGALNSFETTLRNYYTQAAKTFRGNKSPSTIEQMKTYAPASRVFTWPIVRDAKMALQKYGFMDSTGNFKKSVTGDLGNFLEDSQFLRELVDRIQGFKPIGSVAREGGGPVRVNVFSDRPVPGGKIRVGQRYKMSTTDPMKIINNLTKKLLKSGETTSISKRILSSKKVAGGMEYTIESTIPGGSTQVSKMVVTKPKGRPLQTQQAFIEDLLTLRKEINKMIYEGWKGANTSGVVRVPTDAARAVLKEINRSVSKALHRKVPGLKVEDEAFSSTMDLIDRGRKLFGDEKAMMRTFKRMKMQARSADDVFTEEEKQVLMELDKIIPFTRKVTDHVYAKEFEPWINNFWRSRSFGQLALTMGGGIGTFAATRDPKKTATVMAGTLALTSPKIIGGALVKGAQAAKLTQNAGKAALKTAKKAGPAIMAEKHAEGRRQKENLTGVTATNPKTGEKVKWDGQKWVPIKT